MCLCISASSSPSHPPPSQSKLELSEQVSNSLKHQLEVQRERAAAALNKIQKQYSEESGRLRQDKTSLEQETEQAKATLLHKERSLNAAMATKMELQMEIQRMSEERNEIKGELRKEVCVCVCVCVMWVVLKGDKHMHPFLLLIMYVRKFLYCTGSCSLTHFVCIPPTVRNCTVLYNCFTVHVLVLNEAVCSHSKCTYVPCVLPRR